MDIVLSLLIGVVAGAFGGMFGVGGGIVMVPAMTYLLHFSQHKAQGTSLAVLMIPVGVLGALNYYKAGNVDIRSAALIAAGFIGGSYFGSKTALTIPEATLRKLFAVFLLFVAVQLWFRPERNPPVPPPSSESATPAPAGPG